MALTVGKNEKEYFSYLEKLRKSGATNMYGSASYLQREFLLERKEAKRVVMKWMKNYNALSKKYGWR